MPDDQQLIEYKLQGKGLDLPSLSVVQSYSKMLLKEELLKSHGLEEPFLVKILLNSFPNALQAKFKEHIKRHPLRREIVATKLCNMIVNEMGFAFVYRMRDETGMSEPIIMRAYLIVRTILNLDAIWEQVFALGTQLRAIHEKTILLLCVRLVRRMTRWFLYNAPELTIHQAITRYQKR